MSADATKPAALPVNVAIIPAELRERRQWVCWEYRPKPNKPAEWTKIPLNPDTGKLASTTDPETWGTLTAALARMERDGLAGVGFVFSEDDPFCGVDLDRSRDPVTGQLTPWAKRIVRDLDSYTEISPSGTGLHVIVRATKPAGRSRRGPLEIYDRGRFFTMTGQQL